MFTVTLIWNNKKLVTYTAKLTILWYDNFGKKQTLLQRNGMTAIPKIILIVNFASFLEITFNRSNVSNFDVIRSSRHSSMVSMAA